MKRLILLCWACGILMGLRAETWVMEGKAPHQWPNDVVQSQPSEGTPPSWAREATQEKVRQFLRAEHPLAEKWQLMSWWLPRHPAGEGYESMVKLCTSMRRWEEAFFWMQRWAREEGGDWELWEQEKEFEPLRQQPQWPQMRRYLQACERIWQESDYSRVCVTWPAGYDGKERLRWVMGFHGFGSCPEDFQGEDFQRLSDAQRLAIIGVSGRRVLGRNSMMWTEDFAKDCAHVAKALAAVRERANLRREGGILVGFSQGGQLATELAAAWSNQVALCVAMSPGSRFPSELRQRLAKNASSLVHQRYFFSWISGEGSGPKQRVDDWWSSLQERGARCDVHVFPGKRHSWPPRYEDYFAVVWQLVE